MVILTVVLGHWNNWFGIEDYATGFLLFVTDLLVIYFILSGYGINFSLERRLSRQQSWKRAILKYYIDRGMRLFPLYWLALIITPLATPDEIPDFLEFKSTTIAIFLGVPIFRAPQLFWFITSLIQCYLLAPVLFLMKKKLGDRNFLFLNLVGLVFLSIITLADKQKNYAFYYRYLLFGHLSAFAMGMMLPGIINQYGTKLKNNMANIAAFLLYIIFAYLAIFKDTFFNNSGLIEMPLLILGALFFCAVTIANNPYLPLRNSFAMVGRYSYPIYLFHPFFIMAILAGLGLQADRRLSNIFILIASMPVFIFICILMQKAADWAVTSINNVALRSLER